jgi:hypothetical protein
MNRSIAQDRAATERKMLARILTWAGRAWFMLVALLVLLGFVRAISRGMLVQSINDSLSGFGFFILGVVLLPGIGLVMLGEWFANENENEKER